MGKRKGNSKGAAKDLRKQAEARLRPASEEIARLAKEDPEKLIHELRVHQVELEIQNAELRESQQRLEEAREKYSDLFDFAPVGYVVLDAKGAIIEANLTVAGMLGIERGYLAGKPFDVFVAAGSKDACFAGRRKVFEEGTAQDAELRLIAKGGGTFWVHMHSRPAFDTEGAVCQCRSSIIDITAKKAAETKIHDLARFPQENPNPVLRADAEGMLLYANDPARDLLRDMGWKEDSPLPDEFLHPLRKAYEDGRVEQFEFTSPSRRVFSFAASSAGGRDVNIYGRDISLRVAAEQDLRESQQDLKHAQEVANVGNWRLDIKNNALLWSDQTYDIFGIEKGTPLTYEKFLEAVDPYDREYVDREWKAALAGEHYDIEHRITVEGKTKWVRQLAELEFDENGTLTGGFGTCQDITAMKEAEEKLRASRDRWRSFIELTGQMAWTTDAAGEVVEDMPGWRRFTGQSEEEIKGWGWLGAAHPDDRRRVRETAEESLKKKTPYETEYRVRRYDGEYRYFLARGVPVFNEDGSVREWVGTCIDITERKAAREELERSREYLNRAQAIGHIGSWKLDVIKNVLTWSHENYRIFERPRDEPQTYETFLECVHPDDRKYVDKMWQAALRGEDYDIEHRLLVGGKLKWVREKAYMEFDDDWKLLGGFGITQDITRQKLAEEELRRSNAELNRFNKVAVGREMRIIEMKKEVNELCERLGEPRRYPLKFLEEQEHKENEDGKEEAEES